MIFMEGTDKSSVITGTLLVLVGMGLMIASFFFWPLMIYAIPIFIIGVVILSTLKEQEYIEPIKKLNKEGKKRK
ncbi:hypothetical protein COU54_02750 [Candidatus Pacearchaeota archaeon CG10_big_fil_rev_8_21_14_0_10_31_24]|nr:MAG: hypothetical protein COU54_02750 [Candidatus Pacearchaeota archaeon CG10_big_fil_rev_8_21_14_0_10_31_24]